MESMKDLQAPGDSSADEYITFTEGCSRAVHAKWIWMTFIALSMQKWQRETAIGNKNSMHKPERHVDDCTGVMHAIQYGGMNCGRSGGSIQSRRFGL